MDAASPADLLRRLADRAPRELEHAPLPLPDGSLLPVSTLPEVQQWLGGCAIRLEAGEDL